MTNAKRSKRGKSSGSSRAPRAGAEHPVSLTLQERFARIWRALRLPLQDATVVVACSGGADSAAALALVRRIAPRLRIIACYVDHRLRPRDSIQRDLAAVRTQARATKATLRASRIDPPLPRRSVEEHARRARYAVLEAVARKARARYVVTGHHSGDAAESVLLALLRGSGLDGAAGMARRRPLGASVSLVRPLLTIDPRRLRLFVAELGLPVSQDETNSDLCLRRNAVRGLLEALERIAPGARRNIARAANLLRGDRMLLRNSERQAWQRTKRDGAANTLAARELRRLPAPLLRRVIRRAVRETGDARDFSLRQCDAIARALRAGRGGSYQAGHAVVQLSAGTLSVEPISAPRSSSHPADLAATIVPVEKNGSIATPWGALTLRVAQGSPPTGAHSADTVRLDYSQLRHATVSVRLPRPGDRCIPSGRHSLTSLARFLAKAGVPKARRPLTPLLCVENRIAAALPFRVMEPYVPRAGAAVLEVRWSPLG